MGSCAESKMTVCVQLWRDYHPGDPEMTGPHQGTEEELGI